MKHVEKYISRKAQKNAIKNMYVLQMLKTKVVLIAIKMQKNAILILFLNALIITIFKKRAKSSFNR